MSEEYKSPEQLEAELLHEQVAAEIGPDWNRPHKRAEIQKAAADKALRHGYTVDELNQIRDPRAVKILYDASRAEATEVEKRKALDRDIGHWRENFRGTPSVRNAGTLISKLLERQGRKR